MFRDSGLGLRVSMLFFSLVSGFGPRLCTYIYLYLYLDLDLDLDIDIDIYIYIYMHACISSL